MYNVSEALNKYNQYNNYYKQPAKQPSKTEAKTSDTEPRRTAQNQKGRFDTYTEARKIPTDKDTGVYSPKSCKNDSYWKNDRTDRTEAQMKKTFGCGDEYDILSTRPGKTDEFGSYMIRSTKKSTIFIDPRFYESITDDPDKIREYSEEIENMKRIDKQMERRAKAKGITIVSRGWYIDKDGGISSWTVTKQEKKVKKSQLEKMRDLQRKIVLKRTEKKKADLKIQKKRSEKKEELLRLQGKKKSAMKERLGRKARYCKVLDINDLEIMRRKNPAKTKTVTSFGSGGLI